jgi:hypothetical protein
VANSARSFYRTLRRHPRRERIAGSLQAEASGNQAVRGGGGVGGCSRCAELAVATSIAQFTWARRSSHGPLTRHGHNTSLVLNNPVCESELLFSRQLVVPSAEIDGTSTGRAKQSPFSGSPMADIAMAHGLRRFPGVCYGKRTPRTIPSSFPEALFVNLALIDTTQAAPLGR